MKKGFKFNYVLKVALNGKSISRNYMDEERAIQGYLYYKNCTNATIGILYRQDDSIVKSFGL